MNAKREHSGEIQALRAALAAAAPEVPMQQDEQGGCVWCGASDGPFDAPLDPADHYPECGWRIARQALSGRSEGSDGR